MITSSSPTDRRIQIALRWLSALFGALIAVQVGRAVDIVGDGESAPVLPASWWMVTVVSIALAALTAGLATSQALKTQAAAEHTLREESQRAWLALGPLRVHGRAGHLLDLATSGATRAARYRGGFLSASVASLSTPLIILAVMGVALGWRVAGLMSLVVVIGPLLIGAFQGMNKNVGDRFRASQSELRAAFLEGIRALESLTYAGAGEAYAGSLARTNELHRRKIMRLLAGNQILILVMDLVFSLAALLLATFLAVQGRAEGTLTLGQAFSLVLLTLLLVAPVDLIGQFFYIGIGGRAAGRQYSALLYEAAAAQAEEIENASGPVSEDTTQRGIGTLTHDEGTLEEKRGAKSDKVAFRSRSKVEKRRVQLEKDADDEQFSKDVEPTGMGKGTWEGRVPMEDKRGGREDKTFGAHPTMSSGYRSAGPGCGKGSGRSVTSSPDVIVVEGVTAGWPGGEDILRNVSLRVGRGEHIALIGASGAGKSTLSAVIQGLLRPRSGRVSITARSEEDAASSSGAAGETYAAALAGSYAPSPEEGQTGITAGGHVTSLRQTYGDSAPETSPTAKLQKPPRIAVVEQRCYLFHGSIADNLRFAKPDASSEEMWEALEQANLADDVRAMPAGIETPLGDQGSGLSGGQAQRLGIARALLLDAPILILDEPTSQVDLAGEALILEALEKASVGRTVLTIAHRQAAVKNADRIFRVENGAVTNATAERGEGKGR